MIEGIIYKATAGFYYVSTGSEFKGEDSLTQTRARGLFRKQGITPYVGDRIKWQLNEDGFGTIEEILPRKNFLQRPPLANLDYMVVVLSVTDPLPNLTVTDKVLAILEHKNIQPLIAITKSDLDAPDSLAHLYRSAGFPVTVANCLTGEGVDDLSSQLAGAFSAFCGNSGVGKSSLLNAIHPKLGLSVGDTSKKLGRGRHTTRHIETFCLPNGGLVADTPGFTALEVAEISSITAEELSDCFRDIVPFHGDCKFADCSHTNSGAGCTVIEALESGKIASSRYQSYVQIYNELKDVKQWQRK